jgi:hypothetical protein
LDTTGCACDAGPATAETAARLANMSCELGDGGRFDYYGVHLGPSGMVHISRRFTLDKGCRDNPLLQCSVCLNKLQVCVRMRRRMGVCGYTCACARAKDCTNLIIQ